VPAKATSGRITATTLMNVVISAKRMPNVLRVMRDIRASLGLVVVDTDHARTTRQRQAHGALLVR